VYETLIPVWSSKGLTIAKKESCSAPPHAAKTDTEPLLELDDPVEQPTATKIAIKGRTKPRLRLKPRIFNHPQEVKRTAFLPQSVQPFYVPRLIWQIRGYGRRPRGALSVEHSAG
jgi:hypothetical protein